MLALADVLAVVLASILLGLWVIGDLSSTFWIAVWAPLWIVLAKLYGLYDRDHRSLRHLTSDELPALFGWAAVGTGSTAALLLLTPAASLKPAASLYTFLAVAGGALTLRGAARTLWRRITPPDRTLVVGRGPLAEATRRKLELFPDIHVRVVEDRDGFDLRELRRAPEWLGGIDRVIVASPTIDEADIALLVGLCRSKRVKLSIVPPARGIFGTAAHLNHIADLPVMEYSTWDVARSTLLLKRALDLAVASTVLVVLAPLLALVGLAIRIDSRGPVIFVQRRAGFLGRPFSIYKFRTMIGDAEAQAENLVPLESLREPMFKLRNDPRVTRVGRLLRHTSLDELPQLVNVLKGEMSLVGPRPEQKELVDRYLPEHRFRLQVKPGMTGPMQVFGRGDLTFEERLAVERDYVENLSLGRDLRILALTLPVVSRARGAY